MRKLWYVSQSVTTDASSPCMLKSIYSAYFESRSDMEQYFGEEPVQVKETFRVKIVSFL